MKLFLSRYESIDAGTFGILVADDLILHTIEKPWRNNKPYLSCIPAGEYDLKPFLRSSGQSAYSLENYLAGVTIAKESHSKRFAILIHPGNSVDDVVGCIAPGMSRTGNQVVDSRRAVQQLFNLLDKETYNTIHIEWGDVA